MPRKNRGGEMPEETKTETVEETKVETFTRADVETMIAEATKNANSEAAGFRHKLKEIEDAKSQQKIKDSESLEELRGILQQKENELQGVTEKVDSLTAKTTAYEQRDEEEFKTLLELVPEALREDVSDESLPLEKRLALAKKLSVQQETKPPAGYRGSGESKPATLQAQYDEAVKNGNMALQLTLKRELFAANKG